MRYLVLAIGVMAIFLSCTSQKSIPQNATDVVVSEVQTPKKPKNIILMIGDGMGITQISAGLYANGNKLNLEQFVNIGLHKSYSSDDLVTDSAAGATAFASGVKTYNGAIGVNPDTVAVKTILETCQDKNMTTGLVATSTIVHATPAAFYAHQKLRKMYEEIAMDLSTANVDFFVGGGKKFFDRREDERNLINEMSANNYVMKSFLDGDIGQMSIDRSKRFGYLTADKDPLPVANGRDYFVPAVEQTINYVKQDNDNGFFVMIEGSQIDWGGHANKSDYIITEMLEFDQAIGKVLEFAKNDGETLVVITADHETGGYAINKGSSFGDIKGAFTSDYHTADLIPVFAFGPGSENFRGIYENIAINHKLMKLLK